MLGHNILSRRHVFQISSVQTEKRMNEVVIPYLSTCRGHFGKRNIAQIEALGRVLFADE